MPAVAALLVSEFLKANISQGSEVTGIRCGGMCNKGFIVNLMLYV